MGGPPALLRLQDASPGGVVKHADVRVPSIGIIIPIRNRTRPLRNTLLSLRYQAVSSAWVTVADLGSGEEAASLIEDLPRLQPGATEWDKRRIVTRACRKMGQLPPKRPQSELCKLTTKIGCPEFTKAHDLRHLFASRAQEAGANPIIVKNILGHASLSMTDHYSHLVIGLKRDALERLSPHLSSLPSKDGDA